MTIKETIYTRVDEKGRVTRRTRIVDQYDETVTNFGYDCGTRYGDVDTVHETSFDKIWDAYADYRKSKEW